MNQAIMIDHESKEIQVNTIRYKLLVIEFTGIVNYETLKRTPAQLSSIFYEMEGILVLDIRKVINLNSEFVRAFTGILHVISERFARYFIITEDQKIYNWIMNYNQLRDVKPVMNFNEIGKSLELDSLIQQFEF
ncbi:hypothetical protein ACO2J1_10225 [Leptospira interrogans]|uniref:hypothetical protein n=1 Tax=Leptospira interrogans TaxID=173 RepID=UPI0002B92B79|nr:hypothetical protein [Leptospira interrogans]ASV08025.1 hypothetical protein B2G47_20605 [Leptospira interrogans serovar Canicola]MCR8626860.1 hypothetical protein [Leptospira interrogans serovar Canicola]OLZ32743.1 hypothetical protein AR546_03375 [Leptospira interrogans serovar Canicola]OQM28446.1 hypothetical protein DV38_15990 [Leptospira interrogans]OQM28812.1 hypothetical protein DV30_16565 [Leptospira interrogans serovar Canicola str. Gui44]